MKKILGFLFALLTSPAMAGVSCSLPFNLTNGTLADATQVMANYNALVTCLANAAAAGVNSDITALTALSIPLTAAQGGSSLYVGGTSTGSANAQVVGSAVPTGFSLTNGAQVLFIAGFANAGPMTLAVAGTAAKQVHIQTPNGDQALVGGEVFSGQWNEVIYHQADDSYHLWAASPQLGGIGPATSIPSQATTDLSLAGGHNASISGTTTVTSFGSNADVNFPLYRVAFTGSLTLTYNAASMILPGAANIQTAANDTAIAMYLGSGNWQVISYTRANGGPILGGVALCGFNALVVKNNAGTPNTNIDVTANSATMVNTSPVTVYRSGVSFTINLTTGTVTSTANGMDGEARPTSGWVYLYMIDNGVAAAGLGSTSATAPTLPSGYPYSCFMGAMRTDGSTNLLRTTQKGNTAQFTVTSATNTAALPVIASGSAGTNCATATPTYASASISSVVPTTATRILASLQNVYNSGSAALVLLAPNNAYSGATSANPPPVFADQIASNGRLSELEIESSNVFWCSNATGGAVLAAGWRDAVNAN